MLGGNSANSRFENEAMKDYLVMDPSVFDSIYFLSINSHILTFYAPNARILDC